MSRDIPGQNGLVVRMAVNEAAPRLSQGTLFDELKDARGPGLRLAVSRGLMPTLTSLACAVASEEDPTVVHRIETGTTEERNEIAVGQLTAMIEGADEHLDHRRKGVAVELFGLALAAGEKIPKLEDRRNAAAQKMYVATSTFIRQKERPLLKELAGILLAHYGEQPPANDGADTTSAEVLVATYSTTRQPLRRTRRLAFAATSTAVVLAVLTLLLVNRSSPGTAHAKSLSLGSLSTEAERYLTGNQAPAPDKQMTAVLGYGDPITGGRPEYRETPHGFTAPLSPGFDSLVNANYHVGDERRFLRVETSLATDAQQLWQLPEKHVVEVRPNEVVWVIVYIDNNAANTPHCALTGPYVATDTRLRVAIWNSSDNHLHIVRAWLTAKNAYPTWITDAIAVLTPNVTTLEPDSSISREYSKLSPQFHTNPTINVESLLLYPGMLIGGNGLVGSCWNNRYYFVLGFRQR